jgi:lipid A ethanolaminephosphotransferase
MLRNILHTDPAEAGELLNLALLPHLVLYGILPAALVMWVRVRRRPAGRAVLWRGGTVVAALLVAVALAGVQYRDTASLVRHHRDVRHLLTPANYLVSLFKISREALATPAGPPQPVGLDAHRVLPAAAGRRATLLVLAIGETVRSANFGLSGYARQNTPEQAALDPIVYPRVEACGTSTEVSVPCLFAPGGRRDYDEERIHRQESLLHVLRRAGLEVYWIDNQSGCKGVCEGLPQEQLGGQADPAWCNGSRCLDGILLPRLAAAADATRGDLVVILHMLGNHGPAYSERYPA